MTRFISTVVCTIGVSISHAQPVWLPAGPQQAGGAYSAQFQQVFTAMYNQAALAQLPAFTAGVFSERRFMLKETALHALTMALPVSAGAFGLSVQQFGFSAFRQQKLGIAYGRPLGARLSIGLQLDYLSTSMQQYGEAATITFEAGCLLHLTPQLHAGFHVFNPPARQLDRSGLQDLPVIYTAGVGYEVSGAFLLSAELVRENSRSLTTARIMGEYRVLPRCSLQLGLSTDPQLSGGGFSFNWQNLRICLSGTYHPLLGITPATAIIWQSAKKGTLP
jgi:hypothetical protein